MPYTNCMQIGVLNLRRRIRTALSRSTGKPEQDREIKKDSYVVTRVKQYRKTRTREHIYETATSFF